MERGKNGRSKLVPALGVEELVGAVILGFRHENPGGAAQIAVVRRGGVHERLRGGDAMFLRITTSISAFTTGPV